MTSLQRRVLGALEANLITNLHMLYVHVYPESLIPALRILAITWVNFSHLRQSMKLCLPKSKIHIDSFVSWCLLKWPKVVNLYV